jgi:dTDP-4-dehydrorhamnose reductase
MINTDKKILILGAKGMLGQDLAKVLVNHNLALWDFENLDITNKNQVDFKIGNLKPKVIINCAAYTAVDDCEKNKEIAMSVNGYAVSYIAKIAKEIDAILLHISTDYIFKGNEVGGYDEALLDFGPLNIYGESKLLGERLLLENANKYYLIRTSWLYGKNGKNFVDTISRLGREKRELKVINDQFGKPTYTVDLARQILYILNNDLPFGVYHVTNETKKGGITWYEFAKKICKLQKLKIKVKPCITEEYPLPAKRPKYSALINTKLPKMRKWQKALKEYINSK